MEEILRRVKGANTLSYEKEVIVVDDGSTDNSKVKISAFAPAAGGTTTDKQNIKIISHEKNQGKGAAIRTGLGQATGDLVLIQDADLEYGPENYQTLLSAFGADNPVIYGSRNIIPREKNYFYCFLGSKLLDLFINLLFNSKLTDAYTGYKLFKADIIKNLNLQSNGFEIEAEITAKLLKQGIKIKEVPITYSPRKYSEGKKIRFKDWFVGLWTIVKNKLRR